MYAWTYNTQAQAILLSVYVKNHTWILKKKTVGVMWKERANVRDKG